MALDRKDVRAKLDPPLHKALTIICDADHMDICDWIEKLIVLEVRRRVHEAQSIAAETADLGITGSQREFPGLARRKAD
jgi:hypothetical protein